MKIAHYWLAIVAAVSLNLINLSPVQASTKLKIESFAKLPQARNLQLSPDGKHLSVIFRKDGEDMLAILDAATKKPLNMFKASGERKEINDVYWVTDERIVYSISESYAWDKQKRSNGELYAVNVDGSKHAAIFGFEAGEQQTGSHLNKKKAEYGGHEILDLLKDDDRNILIAFYPWKLKGNFWVYNPNVSPTIYKLNIFNGKKYKQGVLPGVTGLTDNQSKVRFSIGFNDDFTRSLYFKKSDDDDWKNFVLKDQSLTEITPLIFTQDNQGVYLKANKQGETNALYLFSLSDQSLNKIYQDPKVDIESYMLDYGKTEVIAVGTEPGLPAYHYLDAKDPKAKLHKQLRNAFAGDDVIIKSASEDLSKVVILVTSDANPGDYFIFHTKDMNAEYILSERPWIDPAKMAKTQSMEFATRDGATISGYLTLPNKKSKNVPLVVMPHGGPHGVRDYWQFDEEVQLLASRGYGVLQVNYRGSGGFGESFEKIGHGKWGTMMQDDLTDATLDLVKKGIADQNKICLYGMSYGGYAALMGTVREPDLYRCAIGSMGVYDLPMMFKEGDIAESKRGLSFLKKVLGNNLDDQKTRSPVYNVAKIKANILLIHGEKDERAPIEQVESMKDALETIDKDYELLELGNEGHGYNDEKNRVKVFNKIIDFLDDNIG